MKSVIKLEKVSKIYKMGETKVRALIDASFTISKGEFVAIIGPSGSGKSTLMHILGLLDRPTSGKVYLEGKVVSRLGEDTISELRNKHLGFVFQTFNLLSRTTALANVELPLTYSDIPREERKELAREALSKVGLGERLNHTPNQLSGGQQQRVAIARALVTKPSLILADEPTGNLDSKSGREILNLLRSLNEAGNTVVLVTHDGSIAKSARRTIELKDGEVIKDTKK